MKKAKVLNLFFILLPVMAVALASTADSVTVFDSVAGTTAHYSYFSLIPDETMQMLPPIAAILGVASVVLAIIAVAKEKPGCVFWVKWLSVISAVAAVMPILMRREDVFIVPNAMLPLLMMGEFLLACLKEKKDKNPESEKNKTVGPRIG